MADFPDPWTLRISAAQEALKRTRYVFLGAMIISGAILISLFNEALSWDRYMLHSMSLELMEHSKPSNKTNISEKAFFCEKGEAIDSSKKKLESTDPLFILAANEICRIRQMRPEKIYERWQKNIGIQNSLLGINVSADDTTSVGPCIIFAILFWWFFTARRENHVISDLIHDAWGYQPRKDASNTRDKLLSAVYYGISSYTVFITVTSDHAPRKLQNENGLVTLRNPLQEKKSNILHCVYRSAVFLPFAAIILSFLLAALTLWQPPPPGRDCGLVTTLFDCLDLIGKIYALGTLAWSLAWGIFAFTTCKKICAFHKVTEDNLRLLGEEIDKRIRSAVSRAE